MFVSSSQSRSLLRSCSKIAFGGKVATQQGRFGASVISTCHYSSTTSQNEKIITTKWADPLKQQYKFWNREESTEKAKFAYLLEISPESMQREARILSMAGPDDVSCNAALHDGKLPMGAKLLGVGETVADFEQFQDAKPNVLFLSPSCPRSIVELPNVLKAFPTIEWVHVRSAGIDFVVSDEFAEFHDKVNVTNAKGQFSSNLSEYVSVVRLDKQS
ncbi:MAG: hypothetical protein SGARI_001963 [Bacillariaceae sp.]